MTRFLVVMIFIFTMACSKNTPTTTAPTETKAETSSRAAATLAAYERARALLADDQVAGLPDAAREIETAATAAGFAAVATSAQALATANDIEKARESFGGVSREVVAVLVADKSLMTGVQIFECPMVKGYRKWIQPSSQDMANPYMGKKMLACGGESSWQ